MKPKKPAETLWTADDERTHPTSTLEWWAVIGFFTTIEDQKHWDIKATLSQGGPDLTHFDALSNIAFFDEDTNTRYVHIDRELHATLQSRPDTFEVHHKDSFMRGTYPSYEIRIHDPEHDITLEMTLQAESLPYWVAHESTHGWLPMGLGFFRYGFIPKMRISGTMKIKEKHLTIQGTGYFEHIWGDFSFRNPLLQGKNLTKTLSIYARLLHWWLRHQRHSLPSSLMWSTENNPLGYDWTWAVLENGWTVFYGNVLSWLMEGPATGVVILSKDGKTFTEFGAIRFRYLKTKSSLHYDFLYPTEFEITAVHGKETLHLRFTMTAECREYISRFSKGRYWLGFVTCEAPGTAAGYYLNNQERVPLKGRCKIEPQRQASIIGHNSLRIEFLKPPQGIGVSIELDSHYLGKKIYANIRLLPTPRLRFSMRGTVKTTDVYTQKKPLTDG